MSTATAGPIRANRHRLPLTPLLALLMAAVEAFQSSSPPSVAARATRMPWISSLVARSSPVLQSSFFEDGFDDEYSDFAPDAGVVGGGTAGAEMTEGTVEPRAVRESPSAGASDGDLLAALRARREQLRGERASDLARRWKKAEITKSGLALALDDWIRRISVDFDAWPLAAVGSADGSIYVADLDTGAELCRVSGAHADGDAGTAMDANKERREAMGRAMMKLYGDFDGGGILSITVRGDWVVSAGRDLGVRVFRIDAAASAGGKSSAGGIDLVSQGKIGDLDGFLVTGLAFDDDDNLWASGFDLYTGEGTVRLYELGDEYQDDDPSPADRWKPLRRIDFDSDVLSLSLNDDLAVGVAALANGSVALFSLIVDDDDEAGRGASTAQAIWRPPFQRTPVGDAGPRVYARTAFIVQNDKGMEDGDRWSVICGGSDGSLYDRELRVSTTGDVSIDEPFIDDRGKVGGRQMLPSHNESVMAFASPSSGILLSGGQDGTIRVWDCSCNDAHDDETVGDKDVGDDDDRRPTCLYALAGYKVWLGSICTDGKRIVSDGADNTIIVHDFSREEPK